MKFEDIRVDDVIKFEYQSGDFKQLKVVEINTFAKYVAGNDVLVYRAEFEVFDNLDIELIHREQIPLPTKRFALIVPNNDHMTGIWLNSSGEWLNDSGNVVVKEQAHKWLNSGDYKIVFEGDIELDESQLEW